MKSSNVDCGLFVSTPDPAGGITTPSKSHHGWIWFGGLVGSGRTSSWLLKYQGITYVSDLNCVGFEIYVAAAS
jgi:hypothetical protein